ncbi:hypothetical protein LEP1GSC050_4171 [Leptospira broomii serovar Hurstbridge str. 5399]|uniref:Uncharacterized protein n=2 Tax=Leptospira broomii TaxID=301541 RepID=T0FA46_9LEPT|nr:hypothetical protein LEP1GSC050_4171 [Leptospira broomii serovar Hurstbridge str. 5399]
MKNKIPYWFAKKIADIINFKYYAFKRERILDHNWTDWKDCQKFNSNRFESLLNKNPDSKTELSPAWKFRSIQIKNRLQGTYRNSLPSIRESYIKKSINDFAKQKGTSEKLTPIFMEAAYLKMTRLNCFARDLRYKENMNRPTKWYLSAKRNYLRMRSGLFSHIADDHTKWDLCFLTNRRTFNNVKLNPWESTFAKVENSLKITLKNER